MTTTDAARELDRLAEAQREKRAGWNEGREKSLPWLAGALMAHVNVVTRWDMDSFFEALKNEHRTLQQSFTSQVVLGWLWHLAHLEEREIDPRNAAAVKIARDVMDLLGNPSRPPQLPTI